MFAKLYFSSWNWTHQHRLITLLCFKTACFALVLSQTRHPFSSNCINIFHIKLWPFCIIIILIALSTPLYARIFNDSSLLKWKRDTDSVYVVSGESWRIQQWKKHVKKWTQHKKNSLTNLVLWLLSFFSSIFMSQIING